MKNQLKKIFTLLAIAGLLVPFVSLADTPAPRSFYGTVLFNGNPVEASLTVTAYCDSIESPISTAQGSTFVNEEDGSLYGTNTLPAPPINPNILQISNCPSDKVVYFTLNVGGNELIANENSTAQSLENNQLNLTFNVPTAPTITSFTATGETVVPNYVNTTNTNFTGGATITAGEATDGYAELLIDGSSFNTPIKDTNIIAGDNSVTFNAGLSDNAAVQAQIAAGERVLKVKICNAAGNCTISTDTKNITADYTAPTISSVALGANEYVNAAETTSGVDIVVTTTGVEDGQIVSCTITDTGTGSVSVHNTISSNTATIATRSLTSLIDGTITATCNVSDAAGNAATQKSDTAEKDVVAPTQTVGSIDISVDTGTDGDFITNASAQTITGTLSAELTAGDVLYGSVNNGSTWENITGKVNVTAISWDGVTLSGTSTILFKITDAAGNDSAPTGAQAYTLDTVAPTVGDDYASNGSLVHTNQTITLSASGGNGSLTIKYCFGNNCVPATLYSTPLVFTTNQDTVVRYQASDSAGNLSEIKGFTLKIIKYDINGGGKVDLADFSVMMSVWGKAANYSDNAFKSDLNADNTVNLADFSILMANWGKEN